MAPVITSGVVGLSLQGLCESGCVKSLKPHNAASIHQYVKVRFAQSFQKTAFPTHVKENIIDLKVVPRMYLLKPWLPEPQSQGR